MTSKTYDNPYDTSLQNSGCAIDKYEGISQTIGEVKQ